MSSYSRRRRDDDDEYLDELDEDAGYVRDRTRRRRRRGIDDDEPVHFDDADSHVERARKEQEHRRCTGSAGREMTPCEFGIAADLDKIERCRVILDNLQFAIERRLNAEHPALVDVYNRFVKSGFTTGDQFRAMIEDGIDSRPVAAKKHLRLVASTKPVKKSIPRRMLSAQAKARTARA